MTEENQIDLPLEEGVTPEPGPAVGIQLFLTQNAQGIVSMHDANEQTVAQVQMTLEQLQQMRDALESMVEHMINMEALSEDSVDTDQEAPQKH